MNKQTICVNFGCELHNRCAKYKANLKKIKRKKKYFMFDDRTTKLCFKYLDQRRQKLKTYPNVYQLSS